MEAWCLACNPSCMLISAKALLLATSKGTWPKVWQTYAKGKRQTQNELKNTSNPRYVLSHVLFFRNPKGNASRSTPHLETPGCISSKVVVPPDEIHRSKKRIDGIDVLAFSLLSCLCFAEKSCASCILDRNTCIPGVPPNQMPVVSPHRIL